MTSNLRAKADRRKKVTPDAGAIGVAASTAPEVSRTDIARKAYELYCARGGQNGSEVDDWLQAERELLQTGPQLLTDAASPRRRAVRKTASFG